MAADLSPTDLDSADYNPIDHLNAIFSHPSTLSSVPATTRALRAAQHSLDERLAAAVARQAASDASSVARIEQAKAELPALFGRVEAVRGRAERTEGAIAAMTADIKQLDRTKRNLARSMTALKRLQMLTTAYEQLRHRARARQYRDCAQLLQAVVQLVGHFRSYRSIDQIAVLSRNVADLQRELLEQVCEDFEVGFAKGEVGARRATLAEACAVVDALGEHARHRIVNWYCNTQLREYRQVFRGSEEAGSLDNISRRYSWFNRLLKTCEVEHAGIWPPHWRVLEALANAFCESTRDDFKGILQREMRRENGGGGGVDVNLLLNCLQETLDFEHSLERRFSNESRSSLDTVVSKDDRAPGFTQAISEAFEPYMSLWVESQDKQLAALIPKYRQQPLRNPDEEFSPQSVIPSSTELFHFYRHALAQCAKLSSGARLLELSKTFAKYLDQYGQQVLFHFLTEKFGAQGPSVEDAVLILNTADYCYHTCNQLEEKIKSRIDGEFRDQVDLQSQADAFMGIASAAVRALVRKVEADGEPAWREMRNTPWAKLDSVGDHSAYVAELVRRVRARSAAILALLQKPQYARAFCDNVVDAVAAAYLAHLALCKPISEVGAEQMLLDAYVLKQGVADLPILLAQEQPAHSNGSSSSKPPDNDTAASSPQIPPSFTKRVTAAFHKLDPILKTLQVRPHPPEALVQAYLIHIADRSDPHFRKILELKGITRKADQAALLDLLHAHRDGPKYAGQLVDRNPVLAALPVPGAAAAGAATAAAATAGSGSSGASLAAALLLPPSSSTSSASPANKPAFDPAAFGSALMSVVGRDSGGTGAAGGATASATTAAGAGAAGAAATTSETLNENLRSLGKFFRREAGSGTGGGGAGATGTGTGAFSGLRFGRSAAGSGGGGAGGGAS